MKVQTEMCGVFFFFSSPKFCLFGRNNSRLGNGVLYASVNPEYFSAADGKSLPAVPARELLSVSNSGEYVCVVLRYL